MKEKNVVDVDITEDEAQILVGVIDNVLLDEDSEYGPGERNLLMSVREKLLSAG